MERRPPPTRIFLSPHIEGSTRERLLHLCHSKNVKLEKQAQRDQLDCFHCIPPDPVRYGDCELLAEDGAEQHYRVVGPQCLLECLTNDTPLPIRSHPVFSLILADCRLSLTGHSRSAKAKLAQLTVQMGGEVVPELTDRVTHVVADSNTAAKYKSAVAHGYPVVQSEWLLACWTAQERVDFEAFRIPTFKGCVVSVTGFRMKERDHIRSIIQDGGGVYRTDLDHKVTHLVQCPGTMSLKYRKAVEWGTVVVSPDWVFDSAKARGILDEGLYMAIETSAPEPSDQRMTRRRAADHAATTAIYEGGVSTAQEFIATTEDLAAAFAAADGDIDELFLEPCRVYLSGFLADHAQRLVGLIRRAGATNITEFSDTVVTHVIIGRRVQQDLRAMRSAQGVRFLSVNWLFDSIRRRRPLSPDEYAIDISERTHSTNATIVTTSEKQELGFAPVVSRKSSVGALSQLVVEPTQAPTRSASSAPRATATLFAGRCFAHISLAQNVARTLCDAIRQHGGAIVTPDPTSSAPYQLIAPHGIPKSDLKRYICPGVEPPVLTTNWLDRCLSDGVLAPVEESVLYTPLSITLPVRAMAPLYACISGYTHNTPLRDEVMSLLNVLGADLNLRLTHKTRLLVCYEACGEKFKAAKSRGNVHIVSHEWLRQVARTGRLAAFEQFPPLPPSSSANDRSTSASGRSSSSASGSFGARTNQPNQPRPARAGATGVASDLDESLLVLKGCNIYVSRKLNQSELFGMAAMLGAATSRVLNTAVTHALFPQEAGRAPDKELKQARTIKDMHIVTPLWLVACQDEKTHVAESLFDTKRNRLASLEVKTDPDESLDPAVPAAAATDAIAPPAPATDTEPKGPTTRSRTGSTPPRVATDSTVPKMSPNRILMPPPPPPSLRSIKRTARAELGVPRRRSTRRRSRSDLENERTSPVAGALPSDLGEGVGVVGAGVGAGDGAGGGAGAVGPGGAAKSMGSPTGMAAGNLLEPAFEHLSDSQVITYQDDTGLKEREQMLKRLKESPQARKTVKAPSATLEAELDDLCKMAATPQDDKAVLKTTPSPARAYGVGKEIRKSPAGLGSKRTRADVAPVVDDIAPPKRMRAQQQQQQPPQPPQAQQQPPQAQQQPPQAQQQPPQQDSDAMMDADDTGAGQRRGRGRTTRYCFQFSTVPAQDRPMLEAVVLRLGGTVSQLSEFDSTVTHVICAAPARTEKCLGAIASGRWVLKPAFLTESSTAGYFVDEKQFEFGGGDAPSRTSEAMYTASRRWRKIREQQASGEKRGCYHSFNVVLYTSDRKRGGFMRLLQAGGAQVQTPRGRPPMTKGLTHAFVEEQQHLPEPHRVQLRRAGIPILRATFIANFLLMDPQPRIDDAEYRLDAGGKRGRGA